MTALIAASGAARRHAWLWRNRGAIESKRDGRLPHLLVDVSGIVRNDARTGIQRVVRAIWSQLCQFNEHGFDVVPVYATRSSGYCYAPADFLSNNAELGREPVRVRSGDKFLGLDLSAHVLPKYRRQLRAWRDQGATIHVVVYDLLPLQRPDWFNASTCRNFEHWFRAILECADDALCISDHVADEFVKLTRSNPTARDLSVGRLYMGADIEASVPSTGVSRGVERLIETIGDGHFILMVGTIEPRKGYDVALRAFDRLWEESPTGAPHLVIVGKAGWKTSALQAAIRSHAEHGSRLHWFADASDEALGELYRRSKGLFLASQAEGCGLPVLEAAAHGRRALVRDLPVFREKHLSGMIYFADDAPEALAMKLLELASSPHLTEVKSLHTWTGAAFVLLRDLGLLPEPIALVSAQASARLI